jgi:transposase
MKGMKAMPEQEYIKHLREKEGKSIASIAKQVGVNWRTAKKYGDCDNWNQPSLVKVKKGRKMDDVIEIVETWLQEDRTRPRKQRHTAIRIYQRLVEEYGFNGSYRTVCYCVDELKKSLSLEHKEAYLRLEHPGGEAQIDFGQVEVILDRKQLKRHLLVLTYPYSNAAFLWLTRRETKVCFLEGLQQLFEMSGGVPCKLWLDNLSAAVVSVKKEGERVITEDFKRFALHYRFEAVFCNPGKGNEKGSVENKVGYSRRNWCVPLPAARTESELQEQLSQRAQRDLDRPHYKKKREQRELWKEEQQKLLQLPTTPYEIYELHMAKTNKYGEIQYENQLLSIPSAGIHESYWLKVKWDRIEILNLQYESIHVFFSFDSHQETVVDLRSRLKPYIQKTRALEYSSVLDYLPESIQTFLLAVHGESRRSYLLWLRQMLQLYTIEEIDQVIPEQVSSESHVCDLNLLEQKLYRNRFPETKSIPMVDPYTPSILKGKEPDLTLYDQLKRTMEVSQ